MSWSTSIIGKPDNVVKALKDQVNKLTDKSLEEYKAANSFRNLVKSAFTSVAGIFRNTGSAVVEFLDCTLV